MEKSKRTAAPTVQLRTGARHPFGMLDGYVPLGSGEHRIYRAIREAVPVVDAAVMKLIRLTGGFSVRCGVPRAERQLAQFLRTVDVGRGQRGIGAFLDGYLDSMITCGRAVGEIVVRGRKEIAAVLCGNVADVQIREGKTPLDLTLCAMSERGVLEPLPYQELLLFTPFHPEADAPYGVSPFAEHALPHGHSAEDLQHHRRELGAGGERAFRRGVQAPGGHPGPGLCQGAGPNRSPPAGARPCAAPKTAVSGTS